MTLIVETGAGIANANSYVTENEFDDYCDARSITPAAGDTEAALIRGTAAIDGAYRLSYPGYRTMGRAQGLEWPRTAAYDYEGLTIDTDAIPQELKDAVCEATIREKADPGSMSPDLERGGAIRSLRAGSVSIDYGGSEVMTTYTIIDRIMSKLLSDLISSTYNARTIRG